MSKWLSAFLVLFLLVAQISFAQEDEEEQSNQIQSTVLETGVTVDAGFKFPKSLEDYAAISWPLDVSYSKQNNSYVVVYISRNGINGDLKSAMIGGTGQVLGGSQIIQSSIVGLRTVRATYNNSSNKALVVYDDDNSVSAFTIGINSGSLQIGGIVPFNNNFFNSSDTISVRPVTYNDDWIVPIVRNYANFIVSSFDTDVRSYKFTNSTQQAFDIGSFDTSSLQSDFAPSTIHISGDKFLCSAIIYPSDIDSGSSVISKTQTVTSTPSSVFGLTNTIVDSANILPYKLSTMLVRRHLSSKNVIFWTEYDSSSVSNSILYAAVLNDDGLIQDVPIPISDSSTLVNGFDVSVSPTNDDIYLAYETVEVDSSSEPKSSILNVVVLDENLFAKSSLEIGSTSGFEARPAIACGQDGALLSWISWTGTGSKTVKSALINQSSLSQSGVGKIRIRKPTNLISSAGSSSKKGKVKPLCYVVTASAGKNSKACLNLSLVRDVYLNSHPVSSIAMSCYNLKGGIFAQYIASRTVVEIVSFAASKYLAVIISIIVANIFIIRISKKS